MTRFALRLLVIGGLLCIFFRAERASAEEPLKASHTADKAASNNEANFKRELIALAAEYGRLRDEANRAETQAGRSGRDVAEDFSDEEWLRRAAADRPKNSQSDATVLAKFLAFAKQHRESPLAVDALAYICLAGNCNDVLAEPWRIKQQAIDEVADYHLNDSRTIHLFDMLAEGTPSHETEKLLKAAIEKGSSPVTRAAAEYWLAKYDQNLDYLHWLVDKLDNKKTLLVYERFIHLIVEPYVKQNFPCDREKNAAEVDRLLNDVVKQYGDVAAKDWQLSDENRLFLETVDFPKPKTYGDLAKALLFELHHLVPGKQAPDIVGTDTDGKTFRLSEYRGKVVLLTFSANWCGGCAELYPTERELVKKYRDQPFAMLSVSRDESIDTLKASLASGELTWRCWWDGFHGPIAAAWNKQQAPEVFLLDQKGIIQDVRLIRTSSQAEFEQAISALFQKIPNQDSAAK